MQQQELSAYRRRVDPYKVEEIKTFLGKCRDALLSEEHTIFAEYKAIPNATRLEHAAANYPLFANDKKKSIKADILKEYNQKLRLFNKSLKDLDMEIIGVPHEFADIQGKRFKHVFMQLAEGIKAKKAAEREEACIRGHQEKRSRLIKISRDTQLKKKLDAEMRRIQRILAKRGKKE